ITLGRKHLVSHQSSCRGSVRAIAETRIRTAVFVPCGQLFYCLGSTRAGVHACGIALWRDASHVPSAAHRTRRIDRPSVMVGTALHDAGPAESLAREPH